MLALAEDGDVRSPGDLPAHLERSLQSIWRLSFEDGEVVEARQQLTP